MKMSELVKFWDDKLASQLKAPFKLSKTPPFENYAGGQVSHVGSFKACFSVSQTKTVTIFIAILLVT